MRRMIQLSRGQTAVLVAMLTLADPLHAGSDGSAQAPLPAAPTQAAPAPGPRTEAKVQAADRTEAHIKRLRAELNITPSQEDLWKSLAQVIRDNEKTMDELHRVRAEHVASMTAVDDIKSYAAIADAHADGLKKFIPVFEALYGSMSGEQKKNADKISALGRASRRNARSQGTSDPGPTLFRCEVESCPDGTLPRQVRVFRVMGAWCGASLLRQRVTRSAL